MAYWPLNVELKNRPCLVVGGGEVGQRKVLSLLEAEADVRVVSQTLTPVLNQLVQEDRIKHLGSEYNVSYLEEAALVFAATSDADINIKVWEDAASRGIWINVADRPDLCSFMVPASIRRGDLTISISTGGKSPALAARIRAGLESEFGTEYAELLNVLGLVRQRILADNQPSGQNRLLFRRLVDSDILENVGSENWAAVEEQIINLLGPNYSFVSLGFKPGMES